MTNAFVWAGIKGVPIGLFGKYRRIAMFRKSLNLLVLTVAVLVAGHVTSMAQTAPVGGKVELLKADGTREPVAGALIEAYRTDIKAGSPSGKTNKKGEFAFVGFMLGGTYALSISAPNIEPKIYTGVKAGQEGIVITVSPGDGRKWTEAEVRKVAADEAKSGGRGADPGNQAPEMTAEEKKARAELEAKNKEIEAKNQKIQSSNEIMARAIKEGNDAYAAKNYDVAIAKYQEGIDADPDYYGSAPIFYNNRGAALTTRAVENYNKAVKVSDPTEKIAGLATVKKDLADAVAGNLKAWNLLKAATGEPSEKNNIAANKLKTLQSAKETFLKAAKTEQIDPALMETAKVLLPEYQSVETDVAKKAEADVIMGDLYRVSGDSDNAIIAYKKILETSPDNLDALSGAGFSLINIGYINNDKVAMQEGANFLQRFSAAAPDTNKFKADAVALLDMLKKEQNVAPQKTQKKKP